MCRLWLARFSSKQKLNGAIVGTACQLFLSSFLEEKREILLNILCLVVSQLS